MKNLAIAILVFCTFICAAYSVKCYKCDDCERGMTTVDCPTNYTCYRITGTQTNGNEGDTRGCTKKQTCELFITLCKNGTEEQKKQFALKECEASCCVSVSDTPCNIEANSDAFIVSIDMTMIVLAVLCSLKLF